MPTPYELRRFQPSHAPPRERILGDELTFEQFQELDNLPTPIADLYCEGKLNSDGCVPTMRFSGVPSATDPSPFLITAEDVTPASQGRLFIGFQPLDLPPMRFPFQNGTVCVAPPHLTTPFQDSGGTQPCEGTYSFDFNALIQGGGKPGAVVGLQVYCQYFYFDALDPFGTGFTNALRFTIQP